jgi:para-aminobenzoate synthetase component I
VGYESHRMDVTCKVLAERDGPTPEAFFWRHRAREGLAWLDGGDRTPSLFVWDPGASVPSGPDWPESLRAMLRPGPSWSEAPFAGGVLGYVGYEAGRHLERMPAPQGPGLLPDLGLRRHDGGLWFHPHPSRWVAAGTQAFVAAAAELLAQAGAPPPAPPPAQGALAEPDRPLSFQRAVRQVLDLIRAGDCYQVNLSRRFTLEGVGDPAAAWLRLRRGSPAGHGAWLSLPQDVVASNSPECFLRVRDGVVESWPIKGTRPRDGSPRDQAWAQELADDPKELAELTMIVDLVRNDLGRVCAPGSIETAPRRVYALPTVHHAEQRVRGRLAPGRDAVDALVASFPPGSVTGAPKVRAMAVLGELEPVPRGVSYGAIGYLADSGALDLSVAIRTATFVGGRASVHVGGGIVADSDPTLEWEETRWKATALLRALTGATSAEPSTRTER